MRLQTIFLSIAIAIFALTGCTDNKKQDNQTQNTVKPKAKTDDGFKWEVDQFADLRVLKYKIPGFDKLSLRQKKLVYFLTQAGYEGRDIAYDQNYRYNLTIRKALENIYKNYSGDKNTDDWKNFEVYLKRIWFSNGIHHHYSNDKIMPKFSKDYFNLLLKSTKTHLDKSIVNILFDPDTDNKKVSLDSGKDLLLSSAVNLYAPDVSQKEVEAYYSKIIAKNDKTPISYGLNSRIYKDKNGRIIEDIYKENGLYGAAIKKIVYWLEKAKTVAENDRQKAYQLNREGSLYLYQLQQFFHPLE